MPPNPSVQNQISNNNLTNVARYRPSSPLRVNSFSGDEEDDAVTVSIVNGSHDNIKTPRSNSLPLPQISNSPLSSNSIKDKPSDPLAKRVAAVVSTSPASTFVSASTNNERKYKRRIRNIANPSELAKSAVDLRKLAKKIGRAHLVWEAPPKTVLIVTKFWDAELVNLTRVVAKWLIEIGMTVYVEEKLRDHPTFDYESFIASSDSENENSNNGNHDRSPSNDVIVDLTTSVSSVSLDTQSSTDSIQSSDTNFRANLHFWDADFCAQQSASPNNEVDFIITLGGDGTVLFAAWMFQNKVPPIIPFHLGSLGFLTVFDFTQFRSSIKKILESDITSAHTKKSNGLNPTGLRMNFRMRFACTIFRKQKTDWIVSTPTTSTGDEELQNDHGSTFQILNDLVVDRGPSPYVSQLELFGNDRHLTTVQADGLVVGTPTGSTAYSLSAGGSVLHPDVSAMLITPICPHTLSFRPMILPDTMELRIVVPEGSRATAWASFDGRRRVQLKQGDSIRIVASNYPVPTVCSGEDQSSDWFEGLERCLGWNRRERQKPLEADKETNDAAKKTELKENEW
ncbi:hypothetical protein HK098_003705 [Nowakowskiella sp. JEL0407]|nr:hypothetical protein HK098_003705 [Nowakowskiella sp. JEL0407]